MNKSFFALSLFAVFFICGIHTGLMAQPITIDDTNMPVPGYSTYVSLAAMDSTSSINPGMEGENLIWDFADLEAESQLKDSFITTPSTYSLSYASATVARRFPEFDSLGMIEIQDAFQFFQNSPEQYELLGLGVIPSFPGIPLSVVYNPTDIMYRFPLNYGDRDTSVTQAIFDLSAFGVFFRFDQVRINHVDAWGTLKTPYGEFEALRIKSFITAFDSVALDTNIFAGPRPDQTEYKWLTKEERVPVFTMDYFNIDSVDQLLAVRYVDSLRNELSTGVFNQIEKAEKLAFYPNPSRGLFKMELPQLEGKPATLQVFGLQGQLIHEQTVNASIMEINLSQFPQGAYTLKLNHKGKVYMGKLLIRN